MKLVDARDRFKPKPKVEPPPAPSLTHIPPTAWKMYDDPVVKQRPQVIVQADKRVSGCLNCGHSLHDHHRDGNGKVHCNKCTGGGAFSCEGAKIHPNKNGEPAMYEAHVRAVSAELSARIAAEVGDTDMALAPEAACRRLDGRLRNVLREFALKYKLLEYIDSIKAHTTVSAGEIAYIEWTDESALEANTPWLAFLRRLPKSIP